jgi:sugar/nucleoside kinase (ribokinase family)
LGLSVACAEKVGTDAFGDLVIALLDEHGVDRSVVARDAAVPTSATVALVDGAGERTFLHAGSNPARPIPARLRRILGVRRSTRREREGLEGRRSTRRCGSRR